MGKLFKTKGIGLIGLIGMVAFAFLVAPSMAMANSTQAQPQFQIEDVQVVASTMTVAAAANIQIVLQQDGRDLKVAISDHTRCIAVACIITEGTDKAMTRHNDMVKRSLAFITTFGNTYYYTKEDAVTRTTFPKMLSVASGMRSFPLRIC